MNLLRFDSEAAWADGVATFWRDRLRSNPRLKICLPSGLTPNPIYAGMVRSVAAGEATFAQASVLVLDEFGETEYANQARITLAELGAARPRTTPPTP